MRYSVSEKTEIIRLVEQSALPVNRTLEKRGIPRATFYRWYDLYQSGGPEALDDRSPRPDRVWNRIPDDIRERIVRLALDEPAVSPRELAVRFTDSKSYFVSEASVPHAGLGTEGLGARPGKGHPPATASLRQRLQLHRGGPGEMARRPEHGARSWRALSSDDPRQDRALASDPQEPDPARELLPAG
jgi:hypothetical protein